MVTGTGRKPGVLSQISVACVASVSIWFRSQERLVLAAREMKRQPKNERRGRGKGRKETLADKPLDFENTRSPANAATDWLGYSNNIDMCRSKASFILRGHVRDTNAVIVV